MGQIAVRRCLLPFAVTASALILAGCAGETPAPEAPKAAAPVASAPAPAPEPPKAMTEEEMMAAWQAAMTPGENHAKLNVFAGKWDVGVSFWMAPGAPPDVSTGTSVTEWILGGRYLQQTFKGVSQGQPFEGTGFSGYDNVQKKYIGTWIDSMGTGMMISTGTADEAGTKFTYDAVMWDPMSGKENKAREEIVVESPDKHVMTMYAQDAASGSQFKTMELVFTRAK